MFKVGEIVKYAPQYCGEGEQYYIHEVKEADDGRYLISTLNTMLTLGSTQRVTEDMIQKASKHEVITWHGKYIVTDTESKKFFAGYDPMGSVIWVDNQDDAEANELEYAEQYKADLESADEPIAKDEPKTMKRIEVLRALAAAHSAFRAELKKYGIEMGTWQPGEPYTLYIDNGPTKPNTILGKYDYKQKIDERIR